MADQLESEDYILLKWGTIKGWCLENSPEAFELLKEYQSIGYSLSAMTQDDTTEQKEIICKMIDKVNGRVQNDWTGEVYDNKENAKKYVMEYANK